MSNNGQYEYNIDLCMCIDKTGSMRPIIDTVKKNVLNLYHDIVNSLEEKGKYVNRLRVRVIWFGDYLADKEPMLVSDFFTLPDETAQFENCVKSVTANGGGDDPEDGLEALAYAIRSDWCTDGWKKRHIIAIFTDAPAHELGYGSMASTYPSAGMPKNFGELSEMWGDEDDPGEMDFSAKRLLMFTPDASFWHTIKEGWENTAHKNVQESAGLKDVTYTAVINTVVNSV